ncbi:MAG: Synerg-CTERM sorting domain-containing protein, partial [Synergistaceae bacterium]
SRAVVLSGDIILTKWAMNGEIAYGAGKIPIAATVCHEMGHQLCGLPDLYDTTYKNKGMGGFSIMAYGTAGAVSGESYGSRPVNLDAWSRYYLGWEKPIEVNSSADLYLTKQQYTGSAETVYLVSGPSSQPYQYYLIEVRDPSDETAWDSGLQKSIETEEFFPGVLVIHVDERVGAGSLDEGNDINEYKDGQHQGVIGVWADTDPRSTENTDSYGTQKSLWYEGNGEEGIFPYALNSAKKFLCSLFFDSEESATPQVYTGIKLFNFSEASADMTASLDYEEDKGGNGGSSSGGCSAGFAAMALIALIPVVLRRKK